MTDRRTALSFLEARWHWAPSGGRHRIALHVGWMCRAPSVASPARHAGPGTGNGAFPVTMWMFDNPAPLDTALCLRVHGAVATPQLYTLAELTALPAAARPHSTAPAAGTRTRHEEQRWRVGDLLDRAGVGARQRFVSFVAATGYRWSLPLDRPGMRCWPPTWAANRSATGVTPLRLVAPGRRLSVGQVGDGGGGHTPGRFRQMARDLRTSGLG
ncbi:MAG: hypothetical protein R3A10_01655 [Caldilineaceae bacterium]